MVAEGGSDGRSRLCPEPDRSDSRLHSDPWLPGRCDLATFRHLASNQADARADVLEECRRLTLAWEKTQQPRPVSRVAAIVILLLWLTLLAGLWKLYTRY